MRAQVLTVTFTPPTQDEDVENKVVTKTVQINVAKAPLTVTAPNRSTIYGAAGAGAETAAIEALLDANYEAVSVSGLVDGDTLADASTTLVVGPTLLWPVSMDQQAQAHLTR